MWAACTCVSPANCQWHPKGKSNRRLISASFFSVFHIILCLYSIQSMPHSAWSVLLKDTFNYSMCSGWIQISVLNFKSVLVLAEGSFTSSSFFYSLFVVFNSVFRTMHYGFCPFYCSTKTKLPWPRSNHRIAAACTRNPQIQPFTFDTKNDTWGVSTNTNWHLVSLIL